MGDQNIEQMIKEVSVATRDRIVRRFVDGESIALILEASSDFVEGCLRDRIEKLEGGLKDAREHFNTLPENAFGALEGHWIRDQIIDEISGILRVTDGIKQEPKDNVTTDMFDEPTNKG